MVVAGILKNAQGKILICRRSPGQSNAGYWEFPGGKPEVGESLQTALERELFEELGIMTKAGSIYLESTHETPTKTIHLVSLYVEHLEGSLALHVHDQALWVDPHDLLDYALTAADIPVAEKLKSGGFHS